MSKGRIYEDRMFQYEDPYSGRTITRLTDYLGHTNHFYFTDPCWFNDGRSMLFNSDREGRRNLFRYDLDTNTITQVTDLPGEDGTPRGCISVTNNACYFWWRGQVIELDLETLDERVIAESPEGWKASLRANPTADGKYICNMILPTLEEEEGALNFGYRRFRELFESKPLTHLVRIEIATGKLEVIFEDRCYMRHVNTSTSRPELLTFCHEGPWNQVEQRIWGVNIHTGDVWKIRDQSVDGYSDHGEGAVVTFTNEEFFGRSV